MITQTKNTRIQCLAIKLKYQRKTVTNTYLTKCTVRFIYLATSKRNIKCVGVFSNWVKWPHEITCNFCQAGDNFIEYCLSDEQTRVDFEHAPAIQLNSSSREINKQWCDLFFKIISFVSSLLKFIICVSLIWTRQLSPARVKANMVDLWSQLCPV